MGESSRKTTGPANDGQGIFLIVLSEVLLAIVNMIVKYVHDWPQQKMMIVRNTTDLCLCLVVCAWCRYEWPGWKTALLLVVRGICYTTFINLFWAALHSCLPLGDVVLMVVTFSPTLFVLLARVQLGEQIPLTWPVQFSMCCLGAVLIIKPGVPNLACPASTALIPLAAALCGGLMNLVSRNTRDVPPVFACVFNDMVVLIFAVAVGGAFSTGGPTSLLPDQIDGNLGLLVAAGFVGWFGLMCNVKGFQSVSAPAVATIAAYMSVALGYGIQVIVFGEPLDKFSVMGAALITTTNIGAILYKHLVEIQPQEPGECCQYKLLAEDGDAIAGA